MSNARTPREVGTALSRNKIMDVAERMIAQNGYAATSIAAICAESGLPVGSVYHHFGSKIGLLREVLQRGRHRLFTGFPPLPPGPAQDRLVAHYGHASRNAPANLPFLRIETGLLLHASREPEIHALLLQMHTGGLERAAGLFTSIAADAGAADPERVGRRIAATTIRFSRGAASQFEMNPQRFSQACADLAETMWNLILASRPGGPETGRRSVDPDPSAPTRALDSARGSRNGGRDSRERFLDAAERLMADCGYAATSVADICARTGRPVGSFYHHFGSKFGLLQAVLDRGIGRFSAALPDVEDHHGSPRDRLHDYYQAAAAAIEDNLDYFRIVLAVRTQKADDPQIHEWMTLHCGRGCRRVSAALQQIAADAGVPDADDFGQRLTDTSLILTDGAVCGLDVEGEGLRVAFADITELLWGQLARQAALIPHS